MKCTVYNALSLSVGILACATAAQARNCTSDDLEGTYNEFRLTSSFESYDAGTSQVVSYDRPSDSPIVGVQGIVIAQPCHQNETTADALVTAGIPESFKENLADKAGSIHLQLPVNLAAGVYSYRLTLATETDECYLYSPVFQCTGANAGDVCAIDDSRCMDAESYVRCAIPGGAIQGGDTTANGTFTGETVTCSPGTSCIQSGNVATCGAGAGGPVVNPGTGNCVIPGSMRCVNETAWEQCVGAGSDWSWASGEQLCSPGTTCGPYQEDYIICQ